MRAIVISLCLSGLVGCGEEGPPTGTVSGIVTIGGEPPTEALRIHFFNSTTGAGSQAPVAEDGLYEISDPFLAGEYRVYFSKFLDPAQLTGAVSTAQEIAKTIPAPYRSESGSPLKKKVAEGENTIDVKIPAAGETP